MAYQTGTASSTEDFMNALQLFAVAEGWTLDIYSTTNDWMAMNNGSVYVQFRWDAQGYIGVFQSLGFVNTSTAPGNHTNDSGLGVVDSSAPYNATLSTTTTNSRVQYMPNGAIVAYHFFTDNTTKYIHCAIETEPGRFYHLSVGTIDKRGVWTGGEYVTSDIGSDTSMPVNIAGSIWQSNASTTSSTVTSFSMHIEGLPGQDVAGKWMIGLTNNTTIGSNSAGNDRAGNPRMTGWAAAYSAGFGLSVSGFPYNTLDGLVPLIPIEVWYKHTPSSGLHNCYLLGWAPDVYVMNMSAYPAGAEITIGADTFMIFPARQKGVSHGNMGYAYRKVV